MQIDFEKLIEDMTKALNQEADLSVWKNDHKSAPLINFLSTLKNLPKSRIPSGDLMRVKNQVLDRISVPAESPVGNRIFAFTRIFRMAGMAMAALVLFATASAGTAAAALNSHPGDTLYPFKKVVENLELIFASDSKKADLQIKFADNRISELENVLAQNEAGKLSEEETQKIISATVKDLQKTTTAAAKNATAQPKVVSKLTDLSNKLVTASIQTEGQVKAEIEKAVASTRISQEEAISNLERAGIKVENAPIVLEDFMRASGKLTAASETSVSIGTARFLLTSETKYVNILASDLAVDQLVDIEAQIKDNKTYAVKITLISEAKTEQPDTDTSDAPQEVQ